MQSKSHLVKSTANLFFFIIILIIFHLGWKERGSHPGGRRRIRSDPRCLKRIGQQEVPHKRWEAACRVQRGWSTTAVGQQVYSSASCATPRLISTRPHPVPDGWVERPWEGLETERQERLSPKTPRGSGRNHHRHIAAHDVAPGRLFPSGSSSLTSASCSSSSRDASVDSAPKDLASTVCFMGRLGSVPAAAFKAV